jgi:GNAT superfamily N-acetyltransferase
MAQTSTHSPYSFTSELNPERAEYVTGQLRDFNRPRASPLWQAPPHPSAPLHLFVLDTEGLVIGGLTGQTHSIPEWLEISVIWVAEAWRGQGLGRQLMQLAEEEAKRQGCRYTRLATGNYQAPDFYPKLGYQLYGRLDNCPQGETVYFFYKQLSE